jgi:phosphatidylglycerol:prolipoprotein diacylglycerol transferase
MVPYFTIPPLHLFGPISIQVYGGLFAVGILVAYRVIIHRTKLDRIPEHEMRRALLCTFGFGLVGAHTVELLFYQPQALAGGWSALWHVLTGLSSIGAFFGGLLGLWIFCKRRNLAFVSYLAIVIEGFVVWWAFVRAGCALAHDHLGTRTNFVLAVNYPTGARHNMGLYEFLMVILVLFPLTIIARKRASPPRVYIAAIFVAYGALRFALDFLRADDVIGADPRYAGLTAAQYGCAVLLVAGLWMLFRLRSGGVIQVDERHLSLTATHDSST